LISFIAIFDILIYIDDVDGDDVESIDDDDDKNDNVFILIDYDHHYEKKKHVYRKYNENNHDRYS
jgi:hypothetical protein